MFTGYLLYDLFSSSRAYRSTGKCDRQSRAACMLFPRSLSGCAGCAFCGTKTACLSFAHVRMINTPFVFTGIYAPIHPFFHTCTLAHLFCAQDRHKRINPSRSNRIDRFIAACITLTHTCLCACSQPNETGDVVKK